MNISDIARLAGVGVGTVSRVLNNHPDVKDSTREKILGIIEESNYIPNNSARILKKSSSKTIGVLVRGVFNPFFSEMIDVISKIISQNGYTMVLQHNDYSDRGELFNIISFVKERRLQGLIYLGCNLTELDETTFESVDIPVVLTSINTVYDYKIKNFSSIGIDNSKAAYDATKHLIDLGHKDIGIVLGVNDDVGIGRERFVGYMHALGESNIEFNQEKVVYGKYSSKDAYNETLELLDKNKEMSAIFAISDIMAVGCAKAIHDKGLVVGKDISLIGFDGMDISEYNIPSITTIRQPRTEMAELSGELVLDLIQNKIENKHITLDTELIKRESCKTKDN